MILEDTIRHAETARVELRKVAGSTQGWADQQRQSFDDQRMKPLADAVDRLITAGSGKLRSSARKPSACCRPLR